MCPVLQTSPFHSLMFRHVRVYTSPVTRILTCQTPWFELQRARSALTHAFCICLMPSNVLTEIELRKCNDHKSSFEDVFQCYLAWFNSITLLVEATNFASAYVEVRRKWMCFCGRNLGQCWNCIVSAGSESGTAWHQICHFFLFGEMGPCSGDKEVLRGIPVWLWHQS